MDQFVGQLLLVPYNFAPRGWAFCDGSLLSISQNTALFSLLGVMYGGDGKSTFALPNLQGSMPVGAGQGPRLPSYIQGQTGGEQTVTLSLNQLAAHPHQHAGTTQVVSTGAPNGATFAQGERQHPLAYYYPAPTSATSAQLNAQALQPTGGGQAHPNVMPSLTLNYIIALTGIYPQRP